MGAFEPQQLLNASSSDLASLAREGTDEQRAWFRAFCRRSHYFTVKAMICFAQSPNLMTARSFKESCDWLWWVVADKKRGLFEDPRDHIKCIAPDQLLPLATGAWVRADEIQPGQRLAHGGDVSDVWYNPPQACVEVDAAGHRIRVSHNHPVKTQRGWVRAADLRIGVDWVQMLAKHDCVPAGGLSEDDAALLGYLVGDGCTTQCVRFTTIDDDDVLEDFLRVAHRFRPRVVRKGKIAEVHLRGAHGFARRHGLFGKRADAKRVPPAIYTAQDAAVAAFLRAYFDCDGTVGDSNGITVTSCHRALLEDVSRLLLRFGVHCRIHDIGPRHFTLDVSHHERYMRFVGFVTGHKRLRAQGRVESGAADVVPSECLALLPRGKRQQFLRRRGVRVNYAHGGLTRRKVSAIAALTGIDFTEWQTPQWRRVTGVRPCGMERTVDITTETHELPVGPFVTHNSYRSTVGLPISLAIQRPNAELDLAPEFDRASRYLDDHPGLKGPDMRLVIACEVEPRATDWVDASRRQWLTNPVLRWAFPELLWPNDVPPKSVRFTQSEYFLPGRRDPTLPDGYLRAISITTSEVGGRTDGLFMDDLTSEKSADSRTEMAYRRNWVRSATQLLDKRQVDDPASGFVLLVTNRWTLDDPNSMAHDELPDWAIWRRSSYKCIVHGFGNCGRNRSDEETECAPAPADPGDPPLSGIWPEKHPDLENVRRDVGERIFATQWLNDPTEDAELDATRALDFYLEPATVQTNQGQARILQVRIPAQRDAAGTLVAADETIPIRALKGHLVSIDPASADEESEGRKTGKTARTAVLWAALDPPTGRVFVFDVAADRYGPDDSVITLFNMYMEAGRQLGTRPEILCEKVAAQTFVSSSLRFYAQAQGERIMATDVTLIPPARGPGKITRIKRRVGSRLNQYLLFVRVGLSNIRHELRHFPSGTLDILDALAQAEERFLELQGVNVNSDANTARRRSQRRARRYSNSVTGY